MGLQAIGIERHIRYFEMAKQSVVPLSLLYNDYGPVNLRLF